MNRDRDLIRGDILSALVNHTNIILNDCSSDAERRQAMVFLIHWIGDIHQSLHVESWERGGVDFPVEFESRTTNLHAVWDFEILNRHRGMGEEKNIASAWADELYGKDSDPAFSVRHECRDVTGSLHCALQWAAEANSWVCNYVLRNGTDSLKNAELANVYYEHAVPVVEDLILKAGRRLGAWLTSIIADQNERGGEETCLLGQY